MASLEFIHVDKRYPDGTSAVRDLNLSARDGEFLIMVGPSGCGKSTALRMAAGLEGITGGELHIDGRAVTHLSPRERDIAMVFQNYALYPHMTVFQNIAFPLENAGLGKAQVSARVASVAQMMGLTEHLARRPKNLSGGQRQRVAMGRALVRQPKVFLMDEPLSNLDAKLRVQMRAEIIRLQRDLGVTTLYVTHDQVEAMTMGDRIAVMRLGVLQQVGTPVELYDSPANLFVAAFIGSPAMSFFEGRLSPDEAPTLTIGAVTFALPAALHAMLRPHAGRAVAVGIRPEHVMDPRSAPPDAPRLSMTTRLVEVIPPEQIVHLDLVARGVDSAATAEAAADNPNAAGDAAAGRVSITARLPSGRLYRPGETADWALDVARLHFFDPATGAAIRNSLR